MADSDSPAAGEARLLSGAIAGDWFRARKVRPLWGQLQAVAQIVATREGPVPIKPGEYLCRGEVGELWPQTREELERSYQAVGPVSADGWQQFAPRPERSVLALEIHEPFRVMTCHGPLNGKPGDLLVKDDDPGRTSVDEGWIVDREIFSKTYERL